MSLTDDWKARKLKAGAYYVRLSNGRVDVAKLSKFNRFYAISYTFEVVEVLSPCDYDLFVELTEKVKELEKEVAKGVEIIGKLLNEGHAAIEKNKQFSSLLKECRTLCKEMIKVNRLYIQGKCICPCKESITDILTRIDAVLGKNERPDNG